MNPDNSHLRFGSLGNGLLLSLALCPLVFSAQSPESQITAQSSTSPIPPDQLLLEDYRPRSIFNVPQTRVEKARFPVIDVHSHAYAKTEADVDRWVRTMDAVGIARTVVMTGATGKRFDEWVALYQRPRGRFELWCGIDYTGFDQPGFGPAALAELDRCVLAGAVGVGELSDKGGGLRGNSGGMHLNDPRMDPILEKCADLRLPVNIHVGEDRWMYEPMDRSNDGLMNAFQWRIPKAPGILRHDEVVATLETEDEHFYAQNLFNYHWPLQGFGLKDAVLKKVYGDNAERIRKSPKRPGPGS